VRDTLNNRLPWGYTWAGVEDVATLAARITSTRLFPFEDRHQQAIDGIIMLLAEAILPPARLDLINAGIKEINAAAEAEKRHHGIYPTTRTGHRFAVYWGPGNHPDTSPADPVDERLATEQVYWALSERDQETLQVFAQHNGDIPAAARELGLIYSTYAARLMFARIHARELWFDWETPRGHYSHAGGRRGPGWEYAHAIRSRVNQRKSAARKMAALWAASTTAHAAEDPNGSHPPHGQHASTAKTRSARNTRSLTRRPGSGTARNAPGRATQPRRQQHERPIRDPRPSHRNQRRRTRDPVHHLMRDDDGLGPAVFGCVVATAVVGAFVVAVLLLLSIFYGWW